MQTGGGSMDLRSEYTGAWLGLHSLSLSAVSQMLNHNLSEHRFSSKKQLTSLRVEEILREKRPAENSNSQKNLVRKNYSQVT